MFSHRPARPAVPRRFRPVRRGETDNKTVIIIVLSVIAGIALLGCVCVVPALLLPAVQKAREAARRTQSQNNLKQIGLAMYNYHDTLAMFPPSGIYGEDGTAYHSWQTMILPYIEQQTLYNQIDFNVPWTDPRNAPAFQHV